MTLGDGYHFARAKQRQAAMHRGLDGLEGTTLAGRDVYGVDQGAEFDIGRSYDLLAPLVGRRYGGQQLGYGLGIFRPNQKLSISSKTIERFILKQRETQLGDKKSVAASFIRVSGTYDGEEELAVRAGIVDVGVDGAFATFQEHMLALGEDIATAFAQQEVIVRLREAGGATIAYTCSPHGFPSPTEVDENVKTPGEPDGQNVLRRFVRAERWALGEDGSPHPRPRSRPRRNT